MLVSAWQYLIFMVNPFILIIHSKKECTVRSHGMTGFKRQAQVHRFWAELVLPSFEAMVTSSHPVKAAPEYYNFALPGINFKSHNS